MADKAKETAPKAMAKTAVYKELAAKTELEPKQVAAVFEALEKLIKDQLGKKGPGVFQVHGVVKFKLAHTKARKAGTRVIAGVERKVEAKPAGQKVKALVLKSLKELNK